MENIKGNSKTLKDITRRSTPTASLTCELHVSWVKDMTVEMGSLIVIIISIAGAYYWARRNNLPLRILLALIFPVAVAFALYWIPIMGTHDKSEYYSWSGVFIGFWVISAVPFSILATYLFRRGRNKQKVH